jgi:hypothetical protein
MLLTYKVWGVVSVLFVSLQPAWGATKTDPNSYPFNVKDTQKTGEVFTNTWDRLFSGDTHKFSAAITYNSGLEAREHDYRASKNREVTKSMVDQKIFFSAQYAPISYFFANVTVQQSVNYFNQYNTFYNYSFGYDDWHKDTFSLVYGNYNENFIFPQQGDKTTAFESGSWTAAYKFGLPQFIDKAQNATCQIGYTITPRYYSDEHEKDQSFKHRGLFGCGYNLPYHLFIRGSAFLYPDNRQKQPWDSDFIYSFGYALYQPGSISVQYTNYTGTRFPWSGHSARANFTGGTVSLTWSLPW